MTLLYDLVEISEPSMNVLSNQSYCRGEEAVGAPAPLGREAWCEDFERLEIAAYKVRLSGLLGNLVRIWLFEVVKQG